MATNKNGPLVKVLFRGLLRQARRVRPEAAGTSPAAGRPPLFAMWGDVSEQSWGRFSYGTGTEDNGALGLALPPNLRAVLAGAFVEWPSSPVVDAATLQVHGTGKAPTVFGKIALVAHFSQLAAAALSLSLSHIHTLSLTL